MFKVNLVAPCLAIFLFEIVMFAKVVAPFIDSWDDLHQFYFRAPLDKVLMANFHAVQAYIMLQLATVISLVMR